MMSIYHAIKTDLIKANTPFTIKLLIGSLVIISFILITLFGYAVFGKLGNKTQYNISATSEYYRYTPKIMQSPLFSISNYQIANNCDPDSISETISGPSELTFERPVTLHITRIYTNKIKLDIQSHDQQYAAAINDFPLESHCTSIFISLNESIPIFSAKLIGDIEIGPAPSDASVGHFPIVYEGELNVADRTLFGELYQFKPYTISRGDRIIVSNKNSANGLLRATYNEPAINSIIISTGGITSIQKYRGNIIDIESTFLTRIKEDHDLAIAISVIIITLQFIYAAIAYLLRIELIEQVIERSHHEKKH